MAPSEQAARFVAQLAFSAIPPAALERAKLALLDCLGVALAGSRAASSAIVLDLLRETAGPPRAAVIGTRLRTSVPDAAFGNGVLCAALLYDDTCLAVPGHVTSTLLPVLLALGEARHASGRALLEAYVAGFELEAALGVATDPEHYERGWHPTSTAGSLGAAAAACRLLGLDAPAVRMALGIATSLASGSRQNFGTMTQALHSGVAARNGAVAALLAARGFTADPRILEAPMGFCALFGAGAEKLAAAIARLGRQFALEQPVLYMKLYPCGFPLQRPIEAAIQLAIEHDLDPEAIEEVRCRVHYLIPQTVFHMEPQTGLEGRTSIPYCVARALIDREMGLAQFTDDKVRDPQVRRLMAKVRVEVPPELAREAVRGRMGAIAAPASLEIRLRDGRTLGLRVEHFRGAPQRPLSPQEIAGKFRACARAALAPERVEAVLGILERLEALADTTELCALLVS